MTSHRRKERITRLTNLTAATLLAALMGTFTPTFAASPNGQIANIAARAPSGSNATRLPAALRPALYQALTKDTGPAYQVNQNGCAKLPEQALKACFNDDGVHIAGADMPLSLRLVAWGRGAKLVRVVPVHPEISDNQVSYVHKGLTEWWHVLPVGFEQGFTITKRPTGHGKLTLALTASREDAGAPHANTLAWGKLRYGNLVVTDANGKLVPATLNSKGTRVSIAVNDTHAVYPLTVDPLVWIEQKATADAGMAGDGFGGPVKISGTTALIGAYKATVGGNVSQGAVYVFTESNGVWNQTGKLVAGDGAANDGFGISIAFDGTTALIGAYHATVNGNPGQGAVYVFSSSGGNWNEVQKLTAGDGAANGSFGVSVALNGTTAFVGALGATYEGAAYVFTESGGSWAQTAKLTASDGAVNYWFGYTIALDGTTALIAAPLATVNGNDYQGAVYVFTESQGTWTQTAKLTASDGAASDEFGVAVALEGKIALIGASAATVDGLLGQGAVYVFAGSEGSWTETQKLTASDGVFPGDFFGISIALSGTTALIGATATTVDGNPLQGAAYVFTESGGTWSQARELSASDGATGEHFGAGVALSDTTAIVGDPDATVNGHDKQGAVYFYGKGDLGLALSAPQSVNQGQQYTNQTIATNNASTASPAVAVTVAVPAAASFVSANATQGSCSEDSGVVTCDFGQIGGNAGTATANVTLKAVGSPGTTIENAAGIAKATPALTASAATEITTPGSCPTGYTEFSGHLDAGGTFTSSSIEVTEAGQKYVDLTAPASFAFFAITDTRYGDHTYVYPHAKHGHRWGAAGTYQVGVQAGPDTGGDYTLCVNLNPAQ